ncbi:translation initiation factor [Neolewinella sp.]|uniref:translation initiation factor n=1 Tax=Neolewinella sp. TaxID=2993543 RepID=UPI003B52233B
MAKKNYAPQGAPQPDENPFAALSQLSNLPPPPDDLPQDEAVAGNAGATQSDPLRVTVDRKYRRGKSATLVTGFTGSEAALQELGKTLKVQCGVGGSVKDGVIIVQGDQRERVDSLLVELGYRVK